MEECRSVQWLMDAFIDNELLSSEAAVVQRHVESCPSCSALLEDLIAIKNSLRELPHERPSPELKTSILGRLEEEEQRRPAFWRRRPLLSLSLAASAAVVALAVFWAAGALRLDEPMYSSMVADHQRVLSPASTTDMMTHDPEALWHWLNQQSSFAIPSSLVFRKSMDLIGGRITTMDGDKVVSIRYRQDNRNASFHIMERHTSMPSSAKKKMVKGMFLFVDKYRGYNIVMWKEGGFLVCAVSDLQQASLFEMIVESSPERGLEV